MNRVKRLTFWFADLSPTDCIFCIYLRFLLLGMVIGLYAAIAVLLIVLQGVVR